MNDQITTIINDRFSPPQKIEVKFVDYTSKNQWKKVVVTHNDAVILGFGRLYDPAFVKNELPKQIKYFKAQTQKIDLATGYRYFARL